MGKRFGRLLEWIKNFNALRTLFLWVKSLSVGTKGGTVVAALFGVSLVALHHFSLMVTVFVVCLFVTVVVVLLLALFPTPKITQFNPDLVPPTKMNGAILFLEVLNTNANTRVSAQLRLVGKSYGDGLKSHAYTGLWDGPDFDVSSRRKMKAQGSRADTYISKDKTELLRIMRIEPQPSYGNFTAWMEGIEEKLMWNVEQKTGDKLPYFELQVQIFGEGFDTPKTQHFRVGPVDNYGRIGMTEVLA